MLDDNKPMRTSPHLLQHHTALFCFCFVFFFVPRLLSLSHTHTSPIINRRISDSCFSLSLVTSHPVVPLGLMFLSPLRWNSRLLFTRPDSQCAFIKASRRRGNELKLPQSSEPIINQTLGLAKDTHTDQWHVSAGSLYSGGVFKQQSQSVW